MEAMLVVTHHALVGPSLVITIDLVSMLSRGGVSSVVLGLTNETWGQTWFRVSIS